MTDPASLPAGPDRLLALLDARRIARGAWTGTDAEGRRTLCALAALSSEVEREERSEACPASLMPAWLAELIPSLDDRTSIEAQPALMRRLGESARRWSALDGAAWDRIRTRFLVACLDEAVGHVTVDEWGVGAAVAGVRRALLGDGDLAAALAAAEAAADAAAEAAEAWAAWAARAAAAWAAAAEAWAAAAAAAWAAAAWAARAAAAWAAEAAAAASARAAAAASARAAEAAADAAAEAAEAWAAAAAAAWAARAARAAAWAARAARAAAWDRLTAALLDAIDAEGGAR